ncbi:hypothetical protein FOZ61_010237 [Perkinsus olseni]|uniref:Uncharacterized protein n=1 Tax=Perkinsus olseni TaxID=32597 RepID=A0A7J6L3C5_PEROL|nr:hypothetical protein FOZ61_010237 [Perkinsus olseni]KAF4653379.1 hypothetical protein FOL46_009223 [Perkinsus olseni]
MTRVTKLLQHLYCLVVVIEYCNASCLGMLIDHDQPGEREYQKIVPHDPGDPNDPEDGPKEAEPRISQETAAQEGGLFTYFKKVVAGDDSDRASLRRAKFDRNE